MTLQQLVALRNNLQNCILPDRLESIIDANYISITNLITNDDIELDEKITSLADNHRYLKNDLHKNLIELETLIGFVQNKIDSMTANFFTETAQQQQDIVRKADIIRQVRQLQKDKEFDSILQTRINLNSNWQYPCLEIGCRDGEYTKFLVASDPLYIADLVDDFLESAVTQFPSAYIGRVRKYLITDFYHIENIPKNQFGFIFSYNYFNYLSFHSIKQLLTMVYDWLRPGGTITFTYNNGDLPAAAAYAESHWMTFVPKSLLSLMVKDLGFEIIFSYDNSPAFSVIELKKPGELKSIKLGQTLGEIRNKK